MKFLCKLFGHKLRGFDVEENVAFCSRCKEEVKRYYFKIKKREWKRECNRLPDIRDSLMNAIIDDREKSIYKPYVWRDRVSEIDKCINKIEEINNEIYGKETK